MGPRRYSQYQSGPTPYAPLPIDLRPDEILAYSRPYESRYPLGLEDDYSPFANVSGSPPGPQSAIRGTGHLIQSPPPNPSDHHSRSVSRSGASPAPQRSTRVSSHSPSRGGALGRSGYDSGYGASPSQPSRGRTPLSGARAAALQQPTSPSPLEYRPGYASHSAYASPSTAASFRAYRPPPSPAFGTRTPDSYSSNHHSGIPAPLLPPGRSHHSSNIQPQRNHSSTAQTLPSLRSLNLLPHNFRQGSYERGRAPGRSHSSQGYSGDTTPPSTTSTPLTRPQTPTRPMTPGRSLSRGGLERSGSIGGVGTRSSGGYRIGIQAPRPIRSYPTGTAPWGSENPVDWEESSSAGMRPRPGWEPARFSGY
ncbi:hypothetical protein P7C70_g1330, partial [Phenoliferia sp. Uapishka_3]